jgi:hypothetical protein
LADEESFDWPVDDLGRCLALAVFREHTRECMDAPGQVLCTSLALAGKRLEPRRSQPALRLAGRYRVES